MSDDTTAADNPWVLVPESGSPVGIRPMRPVDTDGQEVGRVGNPVRTLVCNLCGNTVQKFGRNDEVSTSRETVWSTGGSYPWSAWDTPGTLSVVSDDASDTSVHITMEGLDADGAALTETVTLTGTTPVVTSATFRRLNRAYVSNGDDLVGDVTISRGASTVATVTAADGQTFIGIYSAPAGSTAEISSVRWGVSKGDEVAVQVRAREDGGVFRTRDDFEVYEGLVSVQYGRQDIPQSGLVFPELTDIEFAARQVSGTGTAKVTVGATILVRSIGVS